MWRKIVLALLLMAGMTVAGAFGSLGLVRGASVGRLYSSASEIPHRHVGLVLGCSRQLKDGSPNPFFNSRIRAATELFRAGKIDYSW
jgi:SanA protein